MWRGFRGGLVLVLEAVIGFQTQFGYEQWTNGKDVDDLY
jgi:hypothetical protein